MLLLEYISLIGIILMVLWQSGTKGVQGCSVPRTLMWEGRGPRGGVTAAHPGLFVDSLCFFLHKISVDLGFVLTWSKTNYKPKFLAFGHLCGCLQWAKGSCGVSCFQGLLSAQDRLFLPPRVVEGAEPGSTFVSQQPQSLVGFYYINIIF